MASTAGTRFFPTNSGAMFKRLTNFCVAMNLLNITQQLGAAGLQRPEDLRTLLAFLVQILETHLAVCAQRLATPTVSPSHTKDASLRAFPKELVEWSHDASSCFSPVSDALGIETHAPRKVEF